MDKLKTIAKAIGSFAPTLATMLGGPLAGTAITALETALGLAPGAGADGITPIVQSGLTPEAIATIHAADLKHAEILGQQKIDLEKINADHAEAFAKLDADDRASARQMQVATRDPIVGRLAWTIVGGFMLLTAGVIILLFVAPDRGTELLKGEAGLFFGTVFGYLANEAKAAAGFYFGSTASSAVKDATIADIAKQP